MEKNHEENIRKQYCEITKKLIEKGKTITTMESCTSGQIASLITDTEGASAVIKGAFVTYSNEGKIMQGVPAETIDKFGVYSKETAAEMAKACRNAYKRISASELRELSEMRIRIMRIPFREESFLLSIILKEQKLLKKIFFIKKTALITKWRLRRRLRMSLKK